MKSRFGLFLLVVVALAGSLVITGVAQNGSAFFLPNNLVVSRSVYTDLHNLKVGDALPPNCTTGNCVHAISDSTYPFVFNNNLVDGSFGVTSRILLDQITLAGVPVSTLEVPNSLQNGVPPTKDQMVTSFSSKSELALNLSTDGSAITFMGYLTSVGSIDVSNSNTPGVVDPTNPVPGQFYRVAAVVDAHGKFRFTETNAYSGNNGRAAILNNSGANLIYTAGNAGNGGNPQPDGVIIGAGAQLLFPEVRALVAQNPGLPTPVASFNITQLGDTADKIGKDTNFRGLTIFNNVIYYTKGSGGNGVNTVYFVDTTGDACPDTGKGLPQNGATLPLVPLDYNPALVQADGLVPTNMCILLGFPTALKSKVSFPFGVWFADANTVYVADEGDGDNTFKNGVYTKAAASHTSGLQKWVFAQGVWSMQYVLQAGLNLGTPYAIAGYPADPNAATGLPWSPATDGLRNLTGRHNADGSVTIFAITSTVSGNGDQGADPNLLVTITDTPSAGAPGAHEAFTVVRAAGFGEVLRGVTLTPGSNNKR